MHCGGYITSIGMSLKRIDPCHDTEKSTVFKSVLLFFLIKKSMLFICVYDSTLVIRPVICFFVDDRFAANGQDYLEILVNSKQQCPTCVIVGRAL